MKFSSILSIDESAVDESVDDEYPPDKLLSFPRGLSFTRVLVLLALFGSIVDFAMFGLPDGPIPYNYPFFVGIVYLVSAIVLLEKIYDRYNKAKHELKNLSERTSDILVAEGYETDPDRIDSEYQSILNKGFHPAVLLGGALIGGAFVFGVMFGLDVLRAYPHLLSNYLYGAAHGLYYGPLLAGMYLVYKISNEYISDIDILAPDGVGGYRDMGDALVSMVTFAIYLVTLDFIIISSVSFLNEPLFRIASLGVYLAMLAFFLLLTLYAVLSIRHRLLTIQEKKVDIMREYFNEVETAFWEKKEAKQSAHNEAAEITTMYTMFNQLNQMALWPLNLYSFAKLAISVGSSLFIFGLDTGLIHLPV
jgi:hypothetical protein